MVTRLPTEQLFDADLQPVSDEELDRRLEAAAKAARERVAAELRNAILTLARRSWALYDLEVKP